MKIFITGISSKLMQQLAALIDFSLHEVIGVSRNPELLNLDNVKIIKGDMHNIKLFEHYLENCDMLIHAAAVTHSFKEQEYFSVNFEATKKLVDIANKNQISKFIYISSNTSGLESGSYGLSKYLSEQYIAKNASNWLIFKIAEVYGGTKNEGIEALIKKIRFNSIIFCPLDVPSKFYPIHISDTVELIYADIFFTTNKKKIIVINGAKGYTFLEIIKLTKAITNSNVKIIFLKKEWMFLIRNIVKLIPFSIGIIPDQIDRLYGKKDFVIPNQNNLIELETYIKVICLIK
ncbi:MAG: NAD-dependent epimerase/dehydratase family protein [Lutibacter sp.]